MEQNLFIINESRRNSSINSENKKSLITFAKLNKYYLIPFLAPVFCMLGNFFIYRIRGIKVVKHEEFILTSYIILSYVGAGSFYFISKFRQKIEEAKENIIYRERRRSMIRFLYNKVFKKSPLKEWILIIVLAFLISIFELFSVFAKKPKNNLFEERLYFILFIPLFSKFILKENIFRHHYFSLLITLAGFILLVIN